MKLCRSTVERLDLVKEDVVIGISASGRTLWRRSRTCLCEYGWCFTGAISNSPNALISSSCFSWYRSDYWPRRWRLYANESRDGSKIILNMITTTAMIQVGKSSAGYMVDVQRIESWTNEQAIFYEDLIFLQKTQGVFLRKMILIKSRYYLKCIIFSHKKQKDCFRKIKWIS